MIINNCAGIGDILFCEPIYRHFADKNEKPTVLIHDHLLWISEYIDSAFFVGASKYPLLVDEPKENEKYIPLRYANQVFRNLGPHDHSDLENMMLDKYRILGLPEDLWKTIKLNYNYEKAARLMKEVGVSPFEEYTLRNEFCQIGKVEIPLTKNKKVLDMCTGVQCH